MTIPVRVSDPALLEQVYRLRVAAWRARTATFPDMPAWTDAHDAGAMHWAILADDAPVAAARLTVHDRIGDMPDAEIFDHVVPADLPGPIGLMTRLVVSKSHAGQGHSRALDLVRIAAARAQACRHIIGRTSAGLARIEAARSLGFDIVGESASYRDGPLAGSGGTVLLMRLD